jgi:hypothetical protein
MHGYVFGVRNEKKHLGLPRKNISGRTTGLPFLSMAYPSLCVRMQDLNAGKINIFSQARPHENHGIGLQGLQDMERGTACLLSL